MPESIVFSFWNVNTRNFISNISLKIFSFLSFRRNHSYQGLVIIIFTELKYDKFFFPNILC